MKRALTTAIAIAVVAACAAGCSADTGSTGGSDAATTTASAAGADVADPDGDIATSSAPAKAKMGTRENPVPVNTDEKISAEWTVKFGPANKNATDVVKKENEFNEIAAGRVPVMAPVTVTYSGAEAQMPTGVLSFSFVTSSGQTYSGSAADDYCGVIPKDISSVAEMYKGASNTANVCLAIPSADVEGGTWVVSDDVSLDGTKHFFAL